MPTGACGINCDVCKLKLMGICSICGPGKSVECRKKLEAQKRLLGAPCPILACAAINKLDYCLRDCSTFPCDNFSSGPYPFSQGFLGMQERRRRQKPPALTHNRTPIVVPPEYWTRLKERDIQALCSFTLARTDGAEGLILRSLGEEIRLDPETSRIMHRDGDRWEPTDDPLLELVALLYLNRVDAVYPLGKDLVGPRDLKEAHYFQGPHSLDLAPLLERYGNDLKGFKAAAEYLDGTPLDMADAAYRLLPFPRIPVYYLLWEGDEEFRPKLSVLFDRSIERCFSASGIWSLVNLVSGALLKGPERA
jgi:hypothetical protein